MAPAPGGVCVGGNVPTDKDDCKKGGWMTMSREDGTTFKNQGDCVSYVNHREKGGGTIEAARAATLGGADTSSFTAARIPLSLIR